MPALTGELGVAMRVAARRRAPRRGAYGLVAIMLVGAALAACGPRRPHSDYLSAARGSGAQAGAAGDGGAGDNGSLIGTVDNGSADQGGAATGGAAGGAAGGGRSGSAASKGAAG